MGYPRLSRTHPLRRRGGLSLIELMVTITLLAIGLVGVSSMFIVGYRTTVHSHFASVATDLASRKFEEMKSAGYNGINSTAFPSTFAVPELPQAAGALSFQPYPASDDANQYLVQVSVQWGGGTGIKGRVNLSTIISNHS